jgi:hypothetical protein
MERFSMNKDSPRAKSVEQEIEDLKRRLASLEVQAAAQADFSARASLSASFSEEGVERQRVEREQQTIAAAEHLRPVGPYPSLGRGEYRIPRKIMAGGVIALLAGGLGQNTWMHPIPPDAPCSGIAKWMLPTVCQKLEKLEREVAEVRKAEGSYKHSRNQIAEEVLKEKKAIFAIRESMIDICIKAYRELTLPGLTYGRLYDAYKKIYPLYDNLREEYDLKGVVDNSLNRMFEAQAMKTEGRMSIMQKDWLRSYHGKQFNSMHERFWNAQVVTEERMLDGGLVGEFITRLREDVLEAMETYERLYGRPHRRKEEFSKM